MSALILIVDDNEKNRNLLIDFSTEMGHESITAANGEEALEMMEKKPDIVLLDILMPKLNGRETLKLLKKNENYVHVPVIMLSALDENDIVIECIKNGADDYLVRPFNSVMLRARIDSSLRKKRLYDLEMKHKDFLEEEVKKKSRELYLAHEKLKVIDNSKTNLLNMIAHEFNTPMNGILGSFDLIMDANTDEATKKDIADIFRSSAKRLGTLIKESFIITQANVISSDFINSQISLKHILNSALRETRELAETRKVSFQEMPSFEDMKIPGDDTLLQEAFSAIFRTAVKLSAKEKNIAIDVNKDNDNVKISINALGTTIPDSSIEKFFEIFGVEDNIVYGGDLGLGPALAKQVLAIFNGTVNIQNVGIEGVKFEILIPLELAK